MKRHRFLSIVLAALLLAALVTACGGGAVSALPTSEATASPIQSDEGYEGTAVPTLQLETEEKTMSPEATEAKLPPEAEEVVQLAREDLARRLDLAPEATGLVSVEAVEWPDTSLGCPQPGMMYAQVITPGFRAVLEAERETYEYHSGGGQLVLCSDDGQPYIRVWPTVLPGEEGAEFDQEKLMDVERLIREKESLGYDVRAARVYLATAQWMNLQERPARANAYLDLALEALEEAERTGKIPSEQLRGTVVPLPTFVPEPESTEGD
jgi:hypothetical protein